MRLEQSQYVRKDGFLRVFLDGKRVFYITGAGTYLCAQHALPHREEIDDVWTASPLPDAKDPNEREPGFCEEEGCLKRWSYD